MLTRFLIAGLFLVGLTGCATTQAKNQHDQLQSRVTELEKKIEEKDAEIVDLQYEVKDLSGKVESGSGASASLGDMDQPVVERVVGLKSVGGNEIIRVNVPAETVQSALKSAGVYTGKVDGKVGAGTKAAIVEFQKGHGLKADGVLGRKTWDELKVYLK